MSKIKEILQKAKNVAKPAAASLGLLAVTGSLTNCGALNNFANSPAGAAVFGWHGYGYRNGNGGVFNPATVQGGGWDGTMGNMNNGRGFYMGKNNSGQGVYHRPDPMLAADLETGNMVEVKDADGKTWMAGKSQEKTMPKDFKVISKDGVNMVVPSIYYDAVQRGEFTSIQDNKGNSAFVHRDFAPFIEKGQANIYTDKKGQMAVVSAQDYNALKAGTMNLKRNDKGVLVPAANAMVKKIGKEM